MISLTDQKYQNKSACKGQGPKEILNHLTLINRHNQYISSEMFLKAIVGLRYVKDWGQMRNCPVIYLIAVSSPHAPGMWRPDYCQIRQAQKQHNMQMAFFSMTALFISETLCKITVDLQQHWGLGSVHIEKICCFLKRRLVLYDAKMGKHLLTLHHNLVLIKEQMM